MRCKGHEALGDVGQGAIGVVGVIPMLESRQVEVDIADNGVGRVIAPGEGENVAGV